MPLFALGVTLKGARSGGGRGTPFAPLTPCAMSRTPRPRTALPYRAPVPNEGKSDSAWGEHCDQRPFGAVLPSFGTGADGKGCALRDFLIDKRYIIDYRC